MADAAYGLNDLQMNGFTAKSAAGTENLNLRVWKGNLRVGIFKSKEFKSLFDRMLNDAKIAIIKRTLAQVIKAVPGSKFPIVFSAWDNETKKWNTDWVMSFVKDDKNVNHIEIQWKGNKCDFVLKGVSGVSMGSDPMTEAERSSVEMDVLENFLTHTINIQKVITNVKQTGNWKNGGDRQSSGGTSAASSVNSDSGEDFFA